MPTDNRPALDRIISQIDQSIAQLQSLRNITHANNRQAIDGKITGLHAKRDKIVARRDRLHSS
jgi:hypothetical protein